LVGDSKQTIFKKDVQLPKKHGRGGQSQNRFARIREEKRDWYTSEIAEAATKHFIDTATHKVNVKALIVSGSANLKNELIKKLDPRIQRSIVNTYDVQYSGEAGFAQTLVLCEADLTDCRYAVEKSLLAKFFNCISSDEGLYSYLPVDTIYALEAGAVETLLVWNELPLLRVEMFQPSTGAKKVVYTTGAKTTQEEKPTETESWEVTASVPLLDWILDHYKDFGSDVQVVSGNSTLGAQFVQGFGGIGGILRYPVEMPNDIGAEAESEEEDYDYEF
jgi:peptide chain release factor subunit 1